MTFIQRRINVGATFRHLYNVALTSVQSCRLHNVTLTSMQRRCLNAMCPLESKAGGICFFWDT